MIYSGFWRRFVALIIDGVVLLIPMIALMFLLSVPALMMNFTASLDAEKIQSLNEEAIEEMAEAFISTMAPSMILISLLFIILPWLYYALMESSPLQATLGKLAMNSIVTDLDGDRISSLRAVGRFAGKNICPAISIIANLTAPFSVAIALILSLLSLLVLVIGYLMAAFTERKQALHDLIAGCLVIQKESNVKPLYDLPE